MIFPIGHFGFDCLPCFEKQDHLRSVGSAVDDLNIVVGVLIGCDRKRSLIAFAAMSPPDDTITYSDRPECCLFFFLQVSRPPLLF